MSPRTIRLRPVPGDVRRARERCAAAAREAYGPDRDGLVDDAEIVASELVTNAIRAGAMLILLELDTGSDALRVSVVDDAPGEVAPRSPRTFDTSGRGLHIVGAVADQWGVESLPDGKRVWADLPVRSVVPGRFSDVAS